MNLSIRNTNAITETKALPVRKHQQGATIDRSLKSESVGVKNRRENRPILQSLRRIPQFGNPDRARMTVNHMERTNLSIRLFNRRFTRKTLGFSKILRNHRLAMALQIAHFNFCRVHSAHKMTPAMAQGLTDHVWTVQELRSATI